MKITYQPKVIEKIDAIMKGLEETGFFTECEISNTEYAYNVFGRELTEKFILGDLDEDFLFTKKEFEDMLHEIFTQNVLEGLKSKGVLNSFNEDDESEDTYFVTEKGRKIAKELGILPEKED